MTRRDLHRPFALAALAALVALVLVARPAAAQSKADAFAGKIPPVSGQLYRKAGRFELTPTANLSLNDAFYRKTFAGLKLGYHFNETWSVSLQAATGSTSRTGSAVVCPQNSACVPADDAMMHQVPGRIRAMGGVELGFSPVYGKLNVFGEQVAHFDLSILLGADAIQHDKILDATAAEALAASGGSPAKELGYGGHLGLGARLFLAQWIALRLEVKDYVYVVDVPNGAVGNDVQNQLFTELGVSFFLPFRNRALP